MYDVIIVGAGPCGVMSAIQAAQRKLKVLLIDHNDDILAKFKVSGNNRCNLTNNKDLKDFLTNFDNGKYFYSLTKNFSPQAIMDYFQNQGVALKQEDNNRIFPVSDSSITLINVLKKDLKDVEIHCNEDVLKCTYKQSFVVTTNKATYQSTNLVLATGGQTWPSLGTSSKNYDLVKSFNHTITPLTIQECPINIKAPLTNLMGLSINTKVKILDNDKVIDQITGSVLFTHFGLSGPAILDASMALNKVDNPIISLELIDNYENTKDYLYRIIKANPTSLLKNLLKDKLPQRLLTYLLTTLNIINIKNTELNKKQIKELTKVLSDFKFEFKSFYQPHNAFLTGGGVKLNEVNNKTLESKLIKNLFIGGELLDVCGKMGGYNISLALTCGYNIGQALKKEII